jgi:hypothetical protein
MAAVILFEGFMIQWFPERRDNDEVLVAYIVKNLESDKGESLKELCGLSDRDLIVLDKRIMHQLKYQTIADQLGLTKERIRQILLALYGRLRQPDCQSLWNPKYINTVTLKMSYGAVPLDQTLLSLAIRTALFYMGIRYVSDFIGKTRRFFLEADIQYTALEEIKRELSEYGLVFMPTTGRRRDETISWWKKDDF